MALWKEVAAKDPVPAGTTAEPAPPLAPRPPRPELAAAAPEPVGRPRQELKESVIAAGLTFEGKIEGSGHVRVSGRFKGDVQVDGTLSIEPGAHLGGSVRAGLQLEYQKSLPDPQEVTRKKLGLKPGMPVVLVCPNVPFDAIFYNGGKSIFEGMWVWLGLSARFLGERKDCKVIIRCHPAEPHYNTIETSRSILNEFLQDLPGNILLVPPQDPVSTYSLMDVADLGLVYASTTGLEMAMRGIPVVCGNPFQHYNGKGFTHDPSSREEYFSMIDRILANPGLYRLSDRQVELAWCYADVYFNQWYIPFPWPGGPLWPHLKEWPMQRMISGEGASKIERTINVLLGN